MTQDLAALTSSFSLSAEFEIRYPWISSIGVSSNEMQSVNASCVTTYTEVGFLAPPLANIVHETSQGFQRLLISDREIPELAIFQAKLVGKQADRSCCLLMYSQSVGSSQKPCTNVSGHPQADRRAPTQQQLPMRYGSDLIMNHSLPDTSCLTVLENMRCMSRWCKKCSSFVACFVKSSPKASFGKSNLTSTPEHG